MMGYFEFLEALLRIAAAYKFNPEQEAIFTSLSQKLGWIIGQLDLKFADALIKPFVNERETLEKQKVYQPRAVVDDDEDEESEDEDDWC